MANALGGKVDQETYELKYNAAASDVEKALESASSALGNAEVVKTVSGRLDHRLPLFTSPCDVVLVPVSFEHTLTRGSFDRVGCIRVSTAQLNLTRLDFELMETACIPKYRTCDRATFSRQQPCREVVYAILSGRTTVQFVVSLTIRLWLACLHHDVVI